MPNTYRISSNTFPWRSFNPDASDAALIGVPSLKEGAAYFKERRVIPMNFPNFPIFALQITRNICHYLVLYFPVLVGIFFVSLFASFLHILTNWLWLISTASWTASLIRERHFLWSRCETVRCLLECGVYLKCSAY